MKLTKFLPAVLILALPTLFNNGAHASQANFEKCVEAALHGPEIKTIQVFRPKFDCKHIKKIPIAEGALHYTGHLSHHLPWRPNDEVYFEFKVINGTLIEDSIKTNIDPGGAAWIVGKITSAIGGAFGVPIPSSIGSKAWDAIAREVSTQDWKGIAKGLIAAIAVESAMIEALPSGTTVRQLSSQRYVDAYQTRKQEFTSVTRPMQSNDTQSWIFTHISGDDYRIQQKSTGRYLDAHTSSDKDFTVVTRRFQDNNTQLWIVKRVGRDTYTLQHKNNRRYLDAHQVGDRDYRIVTRPFQRNDTQRWQLELDCKNTDTRCVAVRPIEQTQRAID